MATRKVEQLHIRVSADWLKKLDYLVKLEGGTRTSYIKRMIEERYALDSEIGDIIARSMQEEVENGKSGKNQGR